MNDGLLVKVTPNSLRDGNAQHCIVEFAEVPLHVDALWVIGVDRLSVTIAIVTDITPDRDRRLSCLLLRKTTWISVKRRKQQRLNEQTLLP
jgi:hypothetical protein